MKEILFVCTGNTCRSPMAACLFNELCEKNASSMHAISAGVYARAGSPASDGACGAMKARGLTLLHHQAQPLSESLLHRTSLIVTMTPQHANLVQERFPSLTVPIRSFSPPIPDPFGGSLTAYQQTATALDTQIIALFEELSGSGIRQNP